MQEHDLNDGSGARAAVRVRCEEGSEGREQQLGRGLALGVAIGVGIEPLGFERVVQPRRVESAARRSTAGARRAVGW